MTGSMWSTLDIHGKCSLEEVKRHCYVHLVFLEGGVLGHLHKKPSVPRLMSISTIPSAASKTDHTLNDTSATATTDHTYSSPTPKPMQESSSEAKPASDHTYAEYSDIPTEPLWQWYRTRIGFRINRSYQGGVAYSGQHWQVGNKCWMLELYHIIRGNGYESKMCLRCS